MVSEASHQRMHEQQGQRKGELATICHNFHFYFAQMKRNTDVPLAEKSPFPFLPLEPSSPCTCCSDMTSRYIPNAQLACRLDTTRSLTHGIIVQNLTKIIIKQFPYHITGSWVQHLQWCTDYADNLRLTPLRRENGRYNVKYCPRHSNRENIHFFNLASTV